MALPVLTKTWQFSVNNSTGLGAGTALDINRTWLRTMKDAMTSFASSPWTMQYSCNSTTAGTAGDGVDRLTTNANLVWANPGTAHSWMVLRQTGVATNLELMISCENASATGAIIRMVVSPSAGFTGGSTTLRPTATDEIGIVFGAWGVGVATAIRWHLMQSSDGQCTRMTAYSGGTLVGTWMIEKPGNPVSGWSSPSLSYANGTAGGLGQAILGSIAGALQAKIGSTVAQLAMSAEALISITGSITFPTNLVWGNIANEVSGEWPMLPLGVISVTSPVRGRHGTFQDMWTGSGGANTGDTYPAGSSNQFAQFGNLIFPWNGTAVLLS